MQDLNALHTLVINSLDEQIAVIDQAGTILDVNFAWTQFGSETGFLPSTHGKAATISKPCLPLPPAAIRLPLKPDKAFWTS